MATPQQLFEDQTLNPGKVIPEALDTITGGGIVKDEIAGEDEIYEARVTPGQPIEVKRTGEMAQQSIDAQAGAMSQDQFLQAIQDGQIGGIANVSADQLKNAIRAQQDPNIPNKFKLKAKNKLDNAFKFYTEKLKTQPQTEVAFGQETAPGVFTFVPTPEAQQNVKLKTVQENIFEGKAAIARVVSGAFEPLEGMNAKDKKRVENTIIRQLSSVDFWDVLVERIKEGPLRGTAIYLPDIAVNYGYDALEAAAVAGGEAVYSFFTNTESSRSFVEEWEKSSANRARASEWWKNLIGDTTGIRELSDEINTMITTTLERQLAANEIDQETFDRITKSKVQTPDGETVETDRVFVSEEMAQTLLNESVSQLTPSAQYAAVLSEAFLTMGGIGGAKIKAGRRDLGDLARDIRRIQERAEAPDAKDFEKDLWGEVQLLKGPIQQTQFLQSRGLLKKANTKSMLYAMEVDRLDANAERLYNEIDDISMTLRGMREAGDTVSSKYKGLQAEQQRLRGMMVRRWLSLRTMPTVKENFVEAAPLAVAMWAGGNYTAEGGEDSFFQGDRFVGEGFAALGYMAIGKPVAIFGGKGAYWINQQMGDVYGKSLEVVENIGSIPFQLLGKEDALKGLLTDGSIANFEKKAGITLDADTKKALGYVARVAGKLDEDGIEQVVASMQRHRARMDQILEEFPVEQRAQVRRVLQEDLATTTGIGWLQSANKLASFKIDARESGSLNQLNQQLNAQNLIQERSYATDRLILRLEELIAGNTDLDDTSEVIKYAKSLKATNVRIMEDLGTERAQLMAQIRTYKQDILTNPIAELPPRVLSTLDELEIQLELNMRRKPDGSAGDIDLAALAERQYNENMDALASRAEGLELLRNNQPSHLKQVARNLEMMTEAMLERMRKTAKSGFIKLDREAAKMGKSIPINNMITELAKFEGDGTQLKDFFSKGSRFFHGPLGKRMYTVANRMAARSLDSIKGSGYDELRNLHKNPNATLTDGTKAYLGEDPRPLDIMLFYMERGEAPDFLATPGEVMDVYSAFRDYGIRTKDEALAAKYIDYASKVEDVVKTNAPELFKQWKDARNIYQREWFDKLRRGPLSKLHKSRGHPLATSTNKVDSENGTSILFDDVSIGEEIPESAAMKDGLFQMNYRTTTPFQLFDDVTNNIDKALRGDDDAIKALIIARDDLITNLSSPGMTGRVFDLTDPKQKTHFDLIRGTMTEVVYAKWGKDLAKQLGERADLDLKAVQSGGYNFDRIENVGELQDLLTVSVKSVNDDGKTVFTKVKLVDFDAMIEKERGIEKLIRENNELALSMNKYQKSIANDMDTLADKVSSDLRIRDAGFEMISDAIGQKGGRFFEDVVLTGNLDEIKRLRDLVLAKNGEKIVLDDVEYDTLEIFDAGIRNQIINGILTYGDLQPITGRKFVAANGVEYTKKAVRNPEKISQALEKENVQQVLSYFMDKEHITYLKNITDYLADQKEIVAKGAIDIAGPQISNIVNPMGTNQLIARSFNLARGMVSPQYVAAEFGVSLAQQAGLDLMKLAAGNKEASELMLRMIKFPKQMTKADLDTFDNMVKDFLVSELGAMGEAGRAALENMAIDTSEDRS